MSEGQTTLMSLTEREVKVIEKLRDETEALACRRQAMVEYLEIALDYYARLLEKNIEPDYHSFRDKYQDCLADDEHSRPVYDVVMKIINLADQLAAAG